MAKCAFCNLILEPASVDVVYEDETVLAFLHLAPVHRGHTLVIPKEHYHSITTLPGDMLQHLMRTAGEIGAAAMRVAGAEAFCLEIANGTCAGQLVPHVHVNVIPRSPMDGIAPPPWTASHGKQKSQLLMTLRKLLQQ